MHRFTYDAREWDPPAPVITVGLAARREDAHIPYSALLDTGADATVVPRSVVDALDLQIETDAVFEGFVDGVQTSYDVLVFTLHLEMPDALGSGTAQALLHDFGPGQEYIILGRDLLNILRVTLDGPRLVGEISV